ncbi:MAG: peptidase M64, partial [Proteobacteria bacterium]|nr:peptidase M64 [Pseudomonadota bacterium]
MRTIGAFLVTLLLCWTGHLSGQSFDEVLTGSTLRVDYHHMGTKGEEHLSFDAAYEEGPWPGSRNHLRDPLNLGEYVVRVYDVSSARMIFSLGYSTMFNEWQSTEEALQGITRTFHETVRMPMPKRPVQV